MQEFQFESHTSYTFLEEIGRGGMGIVYLAERNSGGVVDYVVLKTLKSLTKDDEDALRQEANLAALLRHENIVKTYGLESIPLSSLPPAFLQSLGALSYLQAQEQAPKHLRRMNFKRSKNKDIAALEYAGEEDEEKRLLLIVMDYVDGINLKALHHEHVSQSLMIPVLIGAFVISRIARALAYAHRHIIHRDISPENILISTQGICKLSDFGIAVATRQQPDYWAGKLSYMAPEQLTNQPIDERIDIFSLGSVAYQMITGVPLVEVAAEQTLEEQVDAVNKQFAKGILPPAAICTDVPEELSQIIMKMLALSPHKRYQRAGEVASDLEKKFLYAKGYGPTNNSLSTYLAIFENRFASYNEEQLEQLSFLKNSRGEIQLKRELDFSTYTEQGLQALESRKNSEVYRRFKGAVRLQKAREEEFLPYIKVKHLDNVIESFRVDRPLTIGQGSHMNISLLDDKVANHHCTIMPAGSAIAFKTIVKDAATTINGSPVVDKELKDGDKIKIGNSLLFFIHQGTPKWQANLPISLDEEIDVTAIAAMSQDFTATFKPSQQALTRLARLANCLLSSTSLSELKLGIIPTALVESVQLLKGQDSTRLFQIRVIRKPIYLLFNCIGIPDDGYTCFVDNFKKHRNRLAQELAEKEKMSYPGKDSDKFKAEDLFKEGQVVVPASNSPSEEDVPAEVNLEDFDSSVLAAQLIVHGFDRIELQKARNEVDLVVYF